MHVLIVDDDRDHADTLQMLLETRGHTADLHFSALGAREGWQRRRPDVAVLDFFLPHLDGLALAQLLHQDDPRLPIVMVTGYARTGLEDQWLRQRGICRVIWKPYPPESFMDELEYLARESQSGLHPPDAR